VTATITAQQILDANAERFRNRITGRIRSNGRNPSSGTIHAVEIKPNWMDAAPLPVPACGSGVGGTSGRLLEPTVMAVTCHRCQNSPAARAAASFVPTPHQLSLDEYLPAAI